MAEFLSGPLILDTHVWIWTVAGERSRLSERAVEEIESAARRGRLGVCAISIWEVAMLEARGRIVLSRPIEDWIREALRAPGMRLLDLSPEIAIESARLPGRGHGDPADRMLIASARVHGGCLATRDEHILTYAAEGHVAALDVGAA